MTDFNTSETRMNLMRAFAGESQARNRYTFAASKAKSMNLYVIEQVFLFTAAQEKEHAEIYYNHLRELSGTTIGIDGTYPVDLQADMVELLRAAVHNEYEEFDPVYQSFGDTANREGFPKIASSFYQIAEIEKTHGDRFALFADLLEKGELFSSKTEDSWICLNCGHIHKGTDAPKVCPVCQHDQGYFIRLSMAPYTIE